MDKAKVQELLFEAMQDVKAKFDAECEKENASARTICHYSEALTKLAHGIMEVQQGLDSMSALEQLQKMLNEIKPT